MSINSAGSADEEFVTAMDSIGKKLEAIRGQFQQLVTQGGIGEFIKLLLDAGTAILKFANSDVGQFIIKMTLATAVVTGLAKGFVALKALGIVTIGKDLILLASGAQTATVAMGALNKVMALSPLFLGVAVVGTIFGIVKAVDNYNKKIAESIEISKENSAQIEVQTKSYQELQNSIKDANNEYKVEAKEIETSASLGKQYLDIIKKLNDAEELNAYQKEQMRSAVNNLNNIYPSLNLQIDEATGKVVKFTDALYDNIEALKQQAIVTALQKDIDKLTESYAQATLTREEYNKLLSETTAAAGGEGAITFGKSSVGWLSSESEKLTNQLDTLESQLETKTKALTKRKEELQVLLEGLGLGGKQTPPQKSSGSGGGGTTEAEKQVDALKELHDVYAKIITDMEHQLFLAQQKGATDETQISMMQKIQQEIHAQADYYRSIGVAENHEYIQALSKQWYSYKNKIKEINDKIAEDAKKAQEESLKAEVELYNAQLTALERYATAQQDAIQKEIDALEQANNEREKSIELQNLENNLAKAQSQKVRIYSVDAGWHWESDPQAAADARKALTEFKQEQAHKSEIDRLNERKDEWSKYVSSFKSQQDKLLNEQKLGMTEEQLIQNQKISNLQSFADKYLSIMQNLVSAQGQLNNLEAPSGGSSSGGIAYDKNVDYQARINEAVAQNAPQYAIDLLKKQRQAKIKGEGLKGYANGSKAIPFNQFAQVGERGSELIIAPHTNMNLAKNTGVVPHTLAENFMEIGKYGLNGLKNLLGRSSGSTSTDKSTHISIANMTVKSDNANDFVKQLKNIVAITGN